MKQIVECVPNFSEGQDKAIIDAIAAAIQTVDGVKLLNVDPGADFNRTVYTFVGEPKPILEAAFQAAKIGIALIDMRKHKGEHARMGALDVMPFIPIAGLSTQECISLSKQFGQRMAEELGVPVFLYANSATKPDRKRLPDIRKGEYEALEEKFKDPAFKPDFGKPVFVPKSGATATGAREILIAYNINLNTNDKTIANNIAGKIRTSGVLKKDSDGKKIIGPDGKPERIPGRFQGVQAGGMMYDEHIAQISMNLLNYTKVNLHDVYEACREEAEKLGVKVTGSEIVGLVPKESLVQAGQFYQKKDNLPAKTPNELVLYAVEKLGLSQLYPFDPDGKVIEYMVEESDHLVAHTVKDFLKETASNSPAPGGGSVAALAGALGASLTSMVCNLTLGKEKYAGVQEEIQEVLTQSEQLRKELTALVDEDTNAFNDVMKAFKMPKETDEQKKKRSAAIQQGYLTAAEVPFTTAKTCIKIFDLSIILAEKGNQNSITDVAVAGHMAYTGFQSAVLNVQINLSSILDDPCANEMSSELEQMKELSLIHI